VRNENPVRLTAPVEIDPYDRQKTEVFQRWIQSPEYIELWSKISAKARSLEAAATNGQLQEPAGSHQPQDFGEALCLCIAETGDVDAATRLAIQRYPRLYEAYANELKNPHP